MQPSLFSRVSATEAELQAVQDILADVLEVLAQVKASQDEIRQNHDARRGPEQPRVMDRRRPWLGRLRNAFPAFGRDRSPSAPDSAPRPALDPGEKDELSFWKIIGRVAITGLFLTTVFMIGLYKLMN